MSTVKVVRAEVLGTAPVEIQVWYTHCFGEAQFIATESDGFTGTVVGIGPTVAPADFNLEFSTVLTLPYTLEELNTGFHYVSDDWLEPLDEDSYLAMTHLRIFIEDENDRLEGEDPSASYTLNAGYFRVSADPMPVALSASPTVRGPTFTLTNFYDGASPDTAPDYWWVLDRDNFFAFTDIFRVDQYEDYDENFFGHTVVPIFVITTPTISAAWEFSDGFTASGWPVTNEMTGEGTHDIAVTVQHALPIRKYGFATFTPPSDTQELSWTWTVVNRWHVGYIAMYNPDTGGCT